MISKNWWSEIECACPSPHADECVEIRHSQGMKPRWLNDDGDGCECACHRKFIEWIDDEDDWPLPE